ncbi:hypothetical protein [Pedobacter endophyticus]|uniref:Uncharacterized protein n=1 Tax=Pedobacter endophyticus TaxID=2789740 RepID=A0A7S9L2F5_9SPHI|nr:hypothetical protein [Pedobacter endophyticus]QPH40916.1 hypothetical protein IZT61_06530 [Pedobacter endophyticus]
MKNAYLFTVAVLLCQLAIAQKTYRINASGTVSPTVSAEPNTAYTFMIDKNFKGKTFDILNNGAILQNREGNILDRSIGKNTEGGYTVTIQPSRKIRECPQCKLLVSDTFTVKLNKISLGTFYLKPQAATTFNLPKEQPISAVASDSPVTFNAAEIDPYSSVINDAILLSELIKDPANKPKIKKFLFEKYGIKEQTDNHFLQNSIPDNIWNSIEGTEAVGGGNISSLGSAIGGLDVTKIADGFAKFIVKRAKEELTIAFFKKFKEDIASYPDLKSVFPDTYLLLSAIDVQIYSYSNYLSNLREAFRSDFLAIDENLPSIITNHPDFFSKDENQKLAFAVRSGCYIAAGVKDRAHPGDIVDGYPVSYLDSITGKDQPAAKILKGAVQSLQLFSESLKETDTTKHTYWVGIDKVRTMVTNKKTLQIYIGLVLQTAKIKYNKITFSTDTSKNFYQLLNTSENATRFDANYQNYKTYFLSLGNKIEELNDLINAYNREATDSVKIERYAGYIQKTAQLIQSAVNIADLPGLSSVNGLNSIETNTSGYFTIVNHITDLAIAINRKRYAAVANHVISIYQTAYVRPAAMQLELNTERSRKPAAAAKSSGLMEKLTKYSAFMANMIDAKNSDEVAAAIESVALPAGSSSIKRQTSFNVSINAYAGLFTGSEVIKGVDANKPFKFNSYGITAPIGLSISKGNSFLPWPFCFIPTGKSGFSSSLFISFVDLGAIAAYRFEDSTTEQVPTIKLADIFSPGLFWSLGIAKTPISVNFGVQTGPNLRKVTSTTNDYSKNTYVRYSLSVCVDVPLLNLYTKSKN